MVIVENVVECPACHKPAIRHDLGAYSAGYIQLWSDGWSLVQDASPPVLRCGSCNRFSPESAFKRLGPLERPLKEFDIELTDSGPKSVGVMKALRTISNQKGTPLSPEAAKQALSSLPYVLASRVPQYDVERIVGELESAGGRCRSIPHVLSPGSPEDWLSAPRATSAKTPLELAEFLDAGPPIDTTLELRVRRHLFWEWNHPFRKNEGWIPLSRRDDAQRTNANKLKRLLSSHNPEERLLLIEIAREEEDFSLASSLLSLSFPAEMAPSVNTLKSLVSTSQSNVIPIDPSMPTKPE